MKNNVALFMIVLFLGRCCFAEESPEDAAMSGRRGPWMETAGDLQPAPVRAGGLPRASLKLDTPLRKAALPRAMPSRSTRRCGEENPPSGTVRTLLGAAVGAGIAVGVNALISYAGWLLWHQSWMTLGLFGCALGIAAGVVGARSAPGGKGWRGWAKSGLAAALCAGGALAVTVVAIAGLFGILMGLCALTSCMSGMFL